MRQHNAYPSRFSVFRQIIACCVLLTSAVLPPSAWAVDTDADGIDDVGGVTLYSTSFDTADANWSLGSWSRANNAAARTAPYVATITGLFSATMTFSYTLPQAARISFWAKSATVASTSAPFYVDNVSVGNFAADKYSYRQSSFLVGTGTHVFKWTVNPNNFGQPFIDDVTITTVTDNCPAVPNADQLDTDQDGQGNACDDNDDNDGVADGSDNCPLLANDDQLNTDGDAQGNACDTDDDNDGVADGSDRWPQNPAAASDPDGDGFPDSWIAGCDVSCQTLSGLSLDNCPALSNVDQQDLDGDGQGNACDTDDDNDGVVDTSDNCPLNNNANQQNTDGDGQGDVCDTSPLTADKVVQLAAGNSHNCILNSLGAVKCWGRNEYGQLGDGTKQYYRARPVDVVGLGSGVKTIFANKVNTCAVMNTGGLKCWGSGSSGKLGNGASVDSNVPVDVSGLDAGVSSVAIGEWHACALMTAGTMKCWGQFNSSSSNVPVDVSGLEGIQAVTAGYGHNCVITATGAVKCWGYGANGEIGDGSNVNRSSPVDVIGLASGVLSIDSASYSNCAKTAVNGLKCWGNRGSGELGDGVVGSGYSTPVDVVGLTSGVGAIAGGHNHYCALMITGAAKCWGTNTNGQLGDGSKSKRYAPVSVLGLGNDNAALAAGADHSCALKQNGAVMCWGDNGDGQLGDNTVTDRVTPQLVYGLGGDSDSDGIGDNVDAFPSDPTEWLDTDDDGIGDNIDPTPDHATTDSDRDTLPDLWEIANGRDPLKADYMVSAGSSHTCALDNAGVKCWGNNTYGQISVPALVSPAAVSAGYRHSCAIDASGVKCWGTGTTNTGTGDSWGQSIPPALSNPTQVSAGYWHTCAIDDAGVHCWGKNDKGQTTVPALSNPVQVAVGKYHSCALDDNGVQCWGFNGGVGRTLVPALVNPQSISLSVDHSCAIDQNGMQCWGNNNAGQTIVPALTTPQLAAVGATYSCALDNGSVQCWGDPALNTVGQTTVPALNNPVALDAGISHTCALTGSGVKCWGRSTLVKVPALDFTQP